MRGFLLLKAWQGGSRYTHAENDNEEKVNIRNVVELEPQVLGDETQGCIFGSSDLVPRVLSEGTPFGTAEIVWQGQIEEQTPTTRLVRVGLWRSRGKVLSLLRVWLGVCIVLGLGDVAFFVSM